MSMRQYGLVETMLKSLPKRIARSASFLERFKAFSLARWVAQGWKTDDPHLVLATLLDNVPSSEADSMIQQAAAQVLILACLFFLFLRLTAFRSQILRSKIKKGTTLAAATKIIDATFPEEHFFEEAKKKVRHKKGRVLRCLTKRAADRH
jgi:hypothetical protein